MFSLAVCFVIESLVCLLVGAIDVSVCGGPRYRVTLGAFEYWRPVGFAGFLCGLE